jgi:hypothetical protein
LGVSWQSRCGRRAAGAPGAGSRAGRSSVHALLGGGRLAQFGDELLLSVALSVQAGELLRSRLHSRPALRAVSCRARPPSAPGGPHRTAGAPSAALP